MNDHDDRFEITGSIAAKPFQLGLDDCLAFPDCDQVADVGELMPGRRGRALRLAAILARARPDRSARFLWVASCDPAFAISLPLEEVAERAVVVYADQGAPLAPGKGGPFRLLVPGHPDECVHVKQLARLELASHAGRDTRPIDDAEHAQLHLKKKGT